MRIGQGYDVHKLVEGRDCIICGVKIPYEKGLLGHSDADVALHALADAILGAAALGDIGKHFPDTDEKYKGADSRMLLREVVKKVAEKGYSVGNADVTIVAQRPKMLPYIEQMRKNVADEVYWKNCITSDTRSEYRNYLAQFPNGRHRTEAQQKIDGVDWSNILSWGFIIAVIIILTIVLSNN